MRPHLILFSLFLLTSLNACDPLVTFTEPQPTGVKNLKQFPNKLVGDYLSLNDNSILSINREIIVRTYDYDLKVVVKDFKRVYSPSEDTIIGTEPKRFNPTGMQDDSIIQHVHFVDTVFQLGDDMVLRKFKGYYFLNTGRSDGSWEVSNMSLSKGKLSIGSISTNEKLQKLQEITEDISDTEAPHTFTPTKKQFRKFVKREGFGYNEVFVILKK